MKRRKKRKGQKFKVTTIVLLLLYLIYNLYQSEINNFIFSFAYPSYDIVEVPKFDGEYFVYINNNNPNFNEEDKTTNSFERYSELDILGRAGVAYANIGVDLMPKDARESIGMVKPSGWHLVKYDIVDGKYLYNRCHLIGFQLTGENANPKNLITCTRHMNAVTMLQYENKVAEYIKKTHNHVLYRVTPIYDEGNLLSKGVQMEALSVEDNGRGIKFNIFVYNVQDGIEIDYTNGESKLIEK